MPNPEEDLRALYRRIRRRGDHEVRMTGLCSPLLSRAAAGRYELTPASFVNAGEIASALWSATGADASGCIFIPACVSHRDEPAADALRSRGLAALLRSRFDATLDAALRPMTAAQIEHAVERGPGGLLRRALMNAAADGCGPVIAEAAWKTAQYAVAAYVGLAAADDERGMRRIEPLIALLPKAVPLLSRREGGHTWYVLAGC